MPSIDSWIYILYDTFRMEGITLHNTDTSPLFRLRWKTPASLITHLVHTVHLTTPAHSGGVSDF